MNEHARNRPIRSFVRREGRLTRAQRRALDELWPRYGLDLPETRAPCDLDAVFGRRAPRVLEIGFGSGEALVGAARSHPDTDYLGVEVYRPGIGRLLLALDEAGVDNVRVFCADAVEVLAHALPAEAIDAVHIFFPDPWPKKRHHKRRLVQAGFVERLAGALKPAGRLLLATDWGDYAEHMLSVVEGSGLFTNLAGAGRYAPRPPARPLTRFEARGQRRGHAVWDLAFARRDGREARHASTPEIA